MQGPSLRNLSQFAISFGQRIQMRVKQPLKFFVMTHCLGKWHFIFFKELPRVVRERNAVGDDKIKTLVT